MRISFPSSSSSNWEEKIRLSLLLLSSVSLARASVCSVQHWRAKQSHPVGGRLNSFCVSCAYRTRGLCAQSTYTHQHPHDTFSCWLSINKCPFPYPLTGSTLNCRRRLRRPTGWCVRVSYVLRSIRHVHWDSTAVPATYKQEEEEEGNNNNSARSQYKIRNLDLRTASPSSNSSRGDECSCCSISDSTSTCHQYIPVYSYYCPLDSTSYFFQ